VAQVPACAVGILTQHPVLPFGAHLPPQAIIPQAGGLVVPIGQVDELSTGIVGVGQVQVAGQRQLGAQPRRVVFIAHGFVHGAVAIGIEADADRTVGLVVTEA
jgi:hypothetical protein